MAVFEHQVTVECLNDYEMTESVTMTMAGAKSATPLISEQTMSKIVKLVATNPEIEFISLPRVRDGTDVKYVKERLNSVYEDRKIKILSKI